MAQRLKSSTNFQKNKRKNIIMYERDPRSYLVTPNHHLVPIVQNNVLSSNQVIIVFN
jgi:hypothetical protein